MIWLIFAIWFAWRNLKFGKNWKNLTALAALLCASLLFLHAQTSSCDKEKISLLRVQSERRFVGQSWNLQGFLNLRKPAPLDYKRKLAPRRTRRVVWRIGRNWQIEGLRLVPGNSSPPLRICFSIWSFGEDPIWSNVFHQISFQEKCRAFEEARMKTQKTRESNKNNNTYPNQPQGWK